MTLLESAALMTDLDFRNRVKVAALKYAQYLALQPLSSNSKTSWVQRTMQSPDIVAQELTPTVVMNVNVQTAGATIDDANLTAAVQVQADMMM